MALPIMSVSGIRGKVGETLAPWMYAAIAFIQTRASGGGRIIVGRDTRPSGEKLAYAAFRGIRRAGGIPLDIGIAPTPTTCFAVKHFGADGGIIITASHNPLPYNGYKMVHRDGRLYTGDECNAIYQDFTNKNYPSFEGGFGATGPAVETLDAVTPHIDKIIDAVDAKRIREAGIKIAVDSINGAAAVIFPKLLERLGVSWAGVHNGLDGNFVHNPEPRPEHLADLAALLQTDPSFWAGFAFDPDADRLAPMAEDGAPISEEMTLALALNSILSKEKTDVATNLSTSMVIEDVARAFGVSVKRAKIGEANVVEAMAAHGCRAGGEGNGGVIYPKISTVRDGLAALALILELMATTGKKISQLAAQWHSYPIVKEKIPIGDKKPADVIEKLARAFSSEKVDTQDGLKIIRDYGWVHVRASNTEPILRCYAEARTPKQAEDLAKMVMEKI